MSRAKAFHIPKALVWRAYQLVKANQGGAGVDQQSLAIFEQKRTDNLYKLWNRMSSGSYMPPPVKAVEASQRTVQPRLPERCRRTSPAQQAAVHQHHVFRNAWEQST